MAQIQVTDLTFSYDGNADDVLNNVTFNIDTDWKLGLIGRNGKGKTTLLNLFMGRYDYRGSIKTAARFDYFPYTVSDPDLTKNAADLILAVLRQLDLGREQFAKNMEDFSEGQKKKVLIAASLITPAHLYIWDEPLNFIDVFSRMQIEKLILRYKPTMLLVEHDVRFQEKVGTDIIRVSGSNLIGI